MCPHLRFWKHYVGVRHRRLESKSKHNHMVASFSPPGPFWSTLQHFGSPHTSRLRGARHGTQDIRDAIITILITIRIVIISNHMSASRWLPTIGQYLFACSIYFT